MRGLGGGTQLESVCSGHRNLTVLLCIVGLRSTTDRGCRFGEAVAGDFQSRSKSGHGQSAETICEQFERDWMAGGEPRLEEFLDDSSGHDADELFEELLLVEVDHRRQSGSVTADEYIVRFPEYEEAVRRVFDSLASGQLPDLPPEQHSLPLGPDTDQTQVEDQTDASSQATLVDSAGGSAVPSSDTPGSRIGPYVIEAELGRGAMGVVYRAHHPQLNRTVALKTIRAAGAGSRTALKRFQLEAQAAAALDHPGIVPVFEVGEYDGTPFFTMALVQGSDLAELVNDEPLDSRRAAEICVGIAQAAEHAHTQGIIHRDLKPHNVLIDADGQPRVTDFGLARSMLEESELTQFGQVLGTPSYMPPEQATGRESGPAADVYSIGAILYRVLAGRPPFQAPTSTATLRQVVEQDAVPLRQLNGQIDRDLETICLKCLEKEPGRRYRSAAALADDLQRFLDGRPITARPVGRIERAIKWCRRRPLVASLIALVFASMATGTAVSVRFAIRAENRTRDAIENLYAARARQTWSEYRDGNVAAARELLESQRPEQEGDVDQRGFEWHYLWGLCHAPLQTFTTENSGIGPIAISPDGTRLVALDTLSPRFLVWDFATGERLQDIAHDLLTPTDLAISPDGKRLAAVGDQRLTLWDLETGEQALSLTGHAMNLQCVAYGPKGRLIATGAGDDPDDPDGRHPGATRPGELYVWDAATGEIKWRLAGHVGRVEDVDFSEDGTRLASVASGALDADRIQTTNAGEAKIWDLATGQELLTLGDEDLRSCAFSPDGRLLACGSWDSLVDRVLIVWDTETGETVHTLTGHEERITSVAFNADGTRLASGSFDDTIRIRDPETGKELLNIRGPEEQVQSPILFTPDGRRIVTHNSMQIDVWNAWIDPDMGRHRPLKSMALGNWHEFLEFKGQHTSAMCLTMSNNGRWLATSGGMGFARVWDLATRRRMHEFSFEDDTNDVRALAFSPNDQILAVAASPAPGTDTVPEGATVGLWDVGSGECLRWLKADTLEVTGLAFSPDGRQLATVSREGTLRVWDHHTGEQLFAESTAGPLWCVSFNPQGTELVAGGEFREADTAESDDGSDDSGEVRGTATFWTVSSRPERNDSRRFDLPVLALAWRGDGQRLAVSTGHRVRVLDSDSRNEVLTLKGHEKYVSTAIFSPDGRRIISASADRSIRIWHAERGFELLELTWDDHNVNDIAITPDGLQLFATGDAMVRMWDARPRTPESQIERDALSLLQVLDIDPGYQPEIIAAIRSDRTIREAVRDKALALAADYREHEYTLWDLTLPIILSPEKTPQEYETALQKMTRAFEVQATREPYIEFGLGVAQYRTGQYTAAVESLQRAVASNYAGPYVRGFLAMAFFRAGDEDQATQQLEQFQQSVDGRVDKYRELLDEVTSVVGALPD